MRLKPILLLLAVLLPTVLLPSTIFAAPPSPTSAQQTAAQPAYVSGQLIVKVSAPAVAAATAASRTNDPDTTDPAAIFAAIPSLNTLNQRYAVTDVSLALDTAALDLLANAPNAAATSAAATETAAAIGLDRIFLLEAPADTDIWEMAAIYNADPNVEYAEPNAIVSMPEPPASAAELIAQTADAIIPDALTPEAIIPNDPFFSQQYSLLNTGQEGGTPGADVNATLAWEIETGSPDVIIAVVDTGINDHPDLQGKIINELSYDFEDGDLIPQDERNHGTRVAGVIAANANNNTGMAGLCWGCRLVSLRMGAAIIQFASLKVAQAIYYAAALQVDVINMSIGGQCSNLWIDVVNYAYAQDIVMVAAAGNVVDFVVYPARFQRVLSLSATDRRDQFIDFSSFGPEVDLAAPGEDMVVTDYLGGIGRGTGTTHSTALTSGIVGLMRSAYPELTNSQIAQILRASAVDLGPEGFDPRYGYGRVDAFAALQLAATPPADAPVTGQETCECVLTLLGSSLDTAAALAAAETASAAPAATSAPSTVDTLYRVRNELLATTPFGQEITQLYYRHSPQVAQLIFTNDELRNAIKSTLAAASPYALSALDGNGAMILDQEIVDQFDNLIAQLTAAANPELGADLAATWHVLNLQAHVGEPVSEIIAQLGAHPQQPSSPAIFLPFVTGE